MRAYAPHAGDVAEMTPDGVLWILGRRHSICKLATGAGPALLGMSAPPPNARWLHALDHLPSQWAALVQLVLRAPMHVPAQVS